MRIKRQKAVKRCMNVYATTFGFRQPYQVLMDGTFLQVCREAGRNIETELGNMLGGKIRAMTTYCCYVELRKLGGEFGKTAQEAKEYEKRRCGHEPAVNAVECIKEIVGKGNKERYIIATQDAGLRAYMRGIAGVPLVYVNRGVLLLERVSESSMERVQEIEKEKVGEYKSEAVEAVSNKKKRKREPNPLSVKKKKK